MVHRMGETESGEPIMISGENIMIVRDKQIEEANKRALDSLGDVSNAFQQLVCKLKESGRISREFANQVPIPAEGTVK